MSVNNIFGRNIEAEQLELEETFEIKLDEVKDDHMKTINSFDMKISAITPNKPYSYYEQTYADLTKWTLLKLPVKASHTS